MRPINRASMFLAAVGLCLSSNSAHADIAESYKCKLKPGVAREQIQAVGAAYLAVQRAANYHDFQLSILFPKYGADISAGTFYWNGVSPNIERLEAAVAIWEGEANSAVLAQWVEIVQGCDSATLYEAVEVQ